MTSVASEHALDVSDGLCAAFHEVIETMFGLPVAGPKVLAPTEVQNMHMTGMIGLAGAEFHGLLRISCSDDGARKLAGALLGGEDMLGDDPAMVADGLGELANMLGGTFKRQVDTSGVQIELSLPSVLEGEGKLIGIGASGRVDLLWQVDGHDVETSLVYSRQHAR